MNFLNINRGNRGFEAMLPKKKEEDSPLVHHEIGFRIFKREIIFLLQVNKVKE